MAEVAATVLWQVGTALATDAAIFIAANAAAINTIAAITASSLHSSHQKRKAAAAARAAFNASLEDRLVMQATVQGPRSRVYGRVRNVDGILFKTTHGDDSEFYTWVVALAGHQVDAIETIYFDDVAVTLDGDGYVQTAPWSNATIKSASVPVTLSGGAGSVTLPHDAVGGSVTVTIETSSEAYGSQTLAATAIVSGTSVTISGGPVDGEYRVFYQYQDTSSPAVRVRKYLGAPGQDLYPDLVATVGGGTDLTSADEFQGMAALLVTMEYSQDAFPTGVPQISAVMRGALVNDPRSGTTAWTENPALIARDWLLYAHGGALQSADLVEAAFTAAANACDVSTAFPAASGTQTRPLYEAGIVIPLDDSSPPDEVLSEIVEAMAGQWCWSAGRVTVRAGVYRAPVVEITEDWVTSAADITVVGQTATADLVNVMRPTISDAAQGYVVVPVAEVRSSAFITLDGDVEWPRELTLGAVTRAVHAQHVCGVLMRETRDGLTCTLPCNLRAYQLEVFDVVELTLPTFGWSGKLFEVLGWQFSLPGGVLLTLRELAAANYSVDTALDEMTSAANTGLPNPSSVPQVEGVALSSGTSTLVDGTLVTRLQVTWDAVASAAVRQSGAIEVQYAKAIGTLGNEDWLAAAPAPGYATTATIYGLQAGVHYLVRVRARNTLGVVGAWSYQAAHRIAGRRRPAIFRQDSEPGADESQDGDLWYDTNADNLQYLRDGGAWVSVRDGGIQAALDAAAAADAAADGKIASFYQTTAPTSADDGDLWFDTDDGNKQYIRAAGVWVLAADTRIGAALTAASDAQATADGKVVTFVASSAPTAEAIGDLWLDSANGNKLSRWNGGAWVAMPMGTGGIDTNAATEVYVDTPAAAVTVTGEMHTPRGFDPAYTTPLCAITFTPSGSGNASVHFEGAARVTNASASLSTYIEWSLQDTAGAWDGWKRLDAVIPPSAASYLVPMQSSRRFAVVAGTTYTIKAYASKYVAADTVTVESIEMRIEVIKR